VRAFWIGKNNKDMKTDKGIVHDLFRGRIMGKIRVKVKAPFGEIVVEGESAKEILSTLKTMPPKFVNEVGSLISSNLTPSLKTKLEGIIEVTTEGPILTTREKLTHYEAIALILFASDQNSSSATQIKRLLVSSGIRSMVPARLNEMTKRGLVFKPNPTRPEFKLTTQGERWVEEVLKKLRGTAG
jgi:predicted transcriptional regulator